MMRQFLNAGKVVSVGSQQVRLVSSQSVAAINGLGTSQDPSRPLAQQDKLLFTPGPLTTSWTTKLAATRDLGSRDSEFIQCIKDVRNGLLEVAGVSSDLFTTVPVQGSGTFGVEATLSSTLPKDSTLLVIANGAYGIRMTAMCQAHEMKYTLLEYTDDVNPNLADIEKLLKNDNGKHSHVAVVHSETTSGVVNDVEAIGAVVKKAGRTFIVDAMSSFGAIPVKLDNIDFLVSSSNKCVEGVPGFSFCIARRSELAKAKGNARSLSLDLHAQWAGLEANSQFRFTPPTHALLGFRQALKELKAEGGVAARAARYKLNQTTLQAGMTKLGFDLYLPKEKQGWIISSYRFPTDNNWDFNKFYNKLNEKNFVIYPGKVSKADCFRIGHIGRLFPQDTQDLLLAIEAVCKEMKTGAFVK